MNFNFELILFYATLISGVIALIDILFFAKKRSETKKMPVVFEYARSFFPILLIVFLLRSFLYEPFRIPSGSLEPTLLMGDFILVNKFDYGVRLPVAHTKLFGSGIPNRGDILIFRWPPNPSVDFIKRVIGLPGDHISYIDKVLYINGQKMPQTFVKDTKGQSEDYQEWDAVENEENLMGVKHNILIDKTREAVDFKDIVVPNNMYFVMGDNRDYSADSRFWGFVPDKNIVGKAVLIWMSWNYVPTPVAWSEIGSDILHGHLISATGSIWDNIRSRKDNIRFRRLGRTID